MKQSPAWALWIVFLLPGCTSEQVDPWAGALEWVGAVTGVGGLTVAGGALRKLAGPSRSQGATDGLRSEVVLLRERVARLEGMAEGDIG